MGIATLCCCAPPACSMTVTAVLTVACGGVASRLNGTTVAVKSGGTTLGTITFGSGGSNSVTFTAVPGTYTILYTLPAPYGFTRTVTVTLACGANTVSAAFVLFLTCTPTMHYGLLGAPNTFIDVADVPTVTLPIPSGAAGTWALSGGTYALTPTNDIDLGTLAASISITYKSLAVTAARAGGGCDYSPAHQWLDGVGITTAALPGCVTPVPSHAYTTHGISGTSDANGDAVVNLTTAEVYDAATNPAVYNVCV